VKSLIEQLTEHILTISPDTELGATQVTIRFWEREVDDYVKQKAILIANLKTLFSLTGGK